MLIGNYWILTLHKISSTFLVLSASDIIALWSIQMFTIW